MTRWSIRARLTAWFAGVLGVVLVALVAAVWWALTDSVTDTIDSSLADRVAAIERFLSQPGTSQAAEELRDDLREYVALDPGWALIRIEDADRVVLYKSEGFAVPRLSGRAATGTPEYLDVSMRGEAVRLLTARIMVRGQPYRVDVALPTGELQEVLAEFQAVVLVLIPLGIVAAALGGYWISGRALAPVDRVTSTARSITADHLDQRLDVPATGDELQRLSETLNAMLDRLSASFEDVRRFTADASHELRTPVSVIRTTAEVALRQTRPSGEYRAALEDVLREAERASALVEDLLLLARSDAGTDQPVREATDVAAIVDGMRPRLAAHADARGLTLSVRCPDTPAVANADRAAVARLVWMLVDNAVKYTPAPGAIAVTLETGSDPNSGIGPSVVLTVRDTGIGMAPEQQARVFDRFYRTDPARSRDSGGAGLGLAIAKSIVERHGGRITIDSEPGKGSCVTVELPGAG
jgi:heavy metal sensor kinase